jgi:hypothetical protein
MKLALAVTLGGMQGLGSTQDSRERPVDRLTASARAQGPVERRSMSQCERGDHAAMESFLCSLGVDLIAFKYGNRALSKSEAEMKLAIALGWKKCGLKLTRRQFDRVACCALMEWTLDFCPTCKGAKEIPNYQDVDGVQPMKPCSECHGTGKRLYTDQERAEAMGEAHDKAMSWAHSLMAQAEALAIRLSALRPSRTPRPNATSARERLERW